MAVRKVGSARIVRELGRGAMGVVYEGYQDDLQRSVAVKELPAASAGQPELAERFRREGIAYAKMRHESLVQVYDFVEKSDALYLITEFVDGADLAKVVAAGGPMSAGAVAAIGAQVAAGLAHAHDLKLLHRDVKPANVLLSCWGEVKITDFGIVKDLKAADITREGMVVGSLPFMAPEVLSTGQYDVRTDIWALGVLLYELASGTRPFKGSDDGTLMRAIVKGDHTHIRTLAPTMPRRLGRAIERCLARKPSKRWPHAVHLARELAQCADELLGAEHTHDALIIMMHERGFVPRGEGYEAPTPGDTALDARVMHETAAREAKSNQGNDRRKGGRNDTKWVALTLLLATAFVMIGWLVWH